MSGRGVLLAPAAQAKRIRQHRGCHSMVEEMLSLPPVIHHFIHQLLIVFFPSTCSLSLSHLSHSVSCATLSLCAAHCPPGRTLHKLARDSASFSSHLNCLPLPSDDWILMLHCKTNKPHTQSQKNEQGSEMRAFAGHFVSRCWESEFPTW